MLQKTKTITPNSNDKELTAFSKHFILPLTPDSNKKSSISPPTQKQTPNRQLNERPDSTTATESTKIQQQ